MEEKYLYLAYTDVHEIIKENYGLVIETVEEALKMVGKNSIIQPDKSSQIFDEKNQNRINCMTATSKNDNVCGVKWVSVFPSNASKGMKNVEAFTILSETNTGGMKCIMNATECTSYRTAAVGAVAAKYLSNNKTEKIGFIGAGEEAKMHFRMIKFVCPTIHTCYVSSRTNRRIHEFIHELSEEYQDVEFVFCGNDYQNATIHSDIIVTAISSQEQVLKAKWIRPGMLYIHVAGLEDEFAVAQKADKIVCDSWNCVRHRKQTITQMYEQGMLEEKDIYGDIGEIIQGEKVGRENKEEFIYFNSVGLAIEDVLLADIIYKKAIEKKIGTWIKK